MLNFLASYPKSGNTWVRIFLDAYLNDHETDLDNIRSSFGDDFAQFHNYSSGISMSRYPSEEQLLGRHINLLRIDWKLKDTFPHLVKTHNANLVIDTIRLFPPQITGKVLYIVRDPRDVVLSFSKHFGKPIDETIEDFGNESYGMKADKREVNDKVTSYLSSWNNHVRSWACADDLEVGIIRYEDLLNDKVDSFAWILNWFNIPLNKARLLRALEASSFSRLKKIEERVGFKERSQKADKFFSKGTAGHWKETLTEEQSNRIIKVARPMMEVFNYVEEIKKAA